MNKVNHIMRHPRNTTHSRRAYFKIISAWKSAIEVKLLNCNKLKGPSKQLEFAGQDLIFGHWDFTAAVTRV
ncbi:hypothetical protein KEM52_000398 [Ascosphaera acerosa]|nr:hypothetical protein KEM52_000398 [Ascosphaera acerosa]